MDRPEMMAPPSSSLEFRIAQPCDIPHVQVIEHLLFPGNGHVYAQNILHASTRNLVATSQGRVVGYASALTAGQNLQGRALWQRIRPYIGCIGIHPSHQRQGIGSELLRRTCEYVFRTTSYRHIYLECSPELVAFYLQSRWCEVPSSEVEALFGPNPTDSRVCRVDRRGSSARSFLQWLPAAARDLAGLRWRSMGPTGREM
jgi:GNAT superfamily N-acetyltransferase